MPMWLSYLAKAYAKIGHLYDAWRCIRDAFAAVETTKERWFEAELNRVAGEIRPNPMLRKPKAASSAHSQSHASSKPNPGISAPQ
jgi:hypothetical protein